MRVIDTISIMDQPTNLTDNSDPANYKKSGNHLRDELQNKRQASGVYIRFTYGIHITCRMGKIGRGIAGTPLALGTS